MVIQLVAVVRLDSFIATHTQFGMWGGFYIIRINCGICRLLQSKCFCHWSWPVDVSICNWDQEILWYVYTKHTWIHKHIPHKRSLTHTLLVVTLNYVRHQQQNKSFASSIKYQLVLLFVRPTPKYMHGKDYASIRWNSGLSVMFCTIMLQHSIKKMCFTPLTKP